jgi:Pao retrotransposon peptidase
VQFHLSSILWERLLQVWQFEISWDAKLPENYIAKWNKWSSALANMATLRIPRCLKTRSDYPLSRTLHCFCNASTKGYGTVVYLCTAYPSGHVDVTFVIGKSRVAPVKFVSIHRLELQAAQLGSRLDTSIVEPLGQSIDCVSFWSDSHWLN